MLRKLAFRTKLVLVVAVPCFALLGFAGLTINSRFDALSSEQQYGHVERGFSALARLSRSVADEGVASQWFIRAPIPNPPSSKTLIFDTRLSTDTAADELRAAVPSLDGRVSPATIGLIEGVLTRVRQIQVGVGSQPGVRAEVDAQRDPGAVYTGLADQSIVAAAAVARDINDRGLSTSLLGVVDLRRAQVAAAAEASVAVNWLLGGPGDVAAWDAAVHDQDTATNAFFATSTPAEARAQRAAVGTRPPDPLRSNVAGVLPSAFPATRSSVYDYLRAVLTKQSNTDQGVNAVQAVVDRTAASKESDARTQLELAAGGTALLLALVLALTGSLIQSVTRPLRALTRAARNVAERRLPQLVDTVRAGGNLAPDQLERLAPINVESHDEIGDLAEAFGNVQRVAVTVAEEQAALLRKGIGDLYVNLARRNQSLLDRQLALLDDLERDTGDPDELATLFELDHLSTRMRRNAESLLVLSGSEQPRQWRTAIPIIDVVRAAAAEIADFARVRYAGFQGDLAVGGHAVSDVTHLLAELLENATAFSPPATPVLVSAAPSDHRYVITVTDEGIGVDDERLARLNALLSRPPAPGLALSRTLGLHVVAYLAARHGIYVQLRRAPTVGIVAVVALPASILARASAPPPGPDPTTLTRPGEGTGPVLETVGAPARPAAAPEDRPTAPVPVAVGLADAPLPGSSAPPAPPGPGREDPLPRRVGRGAAPDADPLVARVPGTHLSHRPAPPPPPGEARPRPERVHDLLTRHARGVREGRQHEDDP
jgi:signal transduction histidine kinase